MQEDLLRARVFSARLSRRSLMGIVAATGATTLLAACGGDPDEDESTPAPTAAAGGSTAATGGSTAAAGDATATEGEADATMPAGTTPAAGETPTASSGTGAVVGDFDELAGTGTEGEEPVKGGRLIIADAQGDNPLDPFKTSWHSTAHFLVFTSYVANSPTLEYIPNTFAGWEVSADGTEVTFEIDERFTFTDGTKVTAEGIKSVVDHILDPDVAAPGAGAYGPITSAEVVDEKTIKWIYEEPYAPLFNGISGAEVPSWTAYEAAGEDFGNNPVGAGPFLVKELIAGNEIVYERNEDFAWPPSYFSNVGPSHFDEVSIKIIKEDATIFAALLSGDIHLGAIPTINVEEARTNKDLTVVEQLDAGIRYVGMNCSKWPFDDQMVRVAVSHAIDRDSIVANALDGYGETLWTPLSLAIRGSDNETAKANGYQYDPEMARAKLEEAGWDLSGDVATKDGKDFEVELMINNADFWSRASQIVQAQLAEVGIKINIQLMEGTALNDATTTGNHQMFLQLYGSTNPSILFYFFSSSRKGATNRAWFSTDELDEMLLAAQAELDQDKQEVIVREIQAYIVEAAPWVTMANPYEFIGIRNEVRNLKIHPQGGYLLHDAWLKA